jgi:hypothetical protein
MSHRSRPWCSPRPVLFLVLLTAFWALLADCAGSSVCSAADLDWLGLQAFAQVDRIDDDWAVLVDGDTNEHPLPLRCLPSGADEGAIFRHGRRDREQERRIYAQVCAWLAALPTAPPARAPTIRCRAPP